MNRLESMQVYVRIAELASFTQAAVSLGMSKAAVSMAVRQLETAFGARLLRRTTRRVRMTPDGLTFTNGASTCSMRWRSCKRCSARARRS